MSEEMPPQLPPDLLALLARERDAHPSYDRLKEGVLEHVERVVTLAGPPDLLDTGQGSPGAGAGQSLAQAIGAKKMIAMGVASFLVGGATGAGVTRMVSHSPNAAPIVMQPVASSSVATAAPSPSDSAVAPPVLNADDLPRVAPPVVASAIASAVAPSGSTTHGDSHSEPAPTPRADLAKERELLDVARAALRRGRPADALAAAQEHAKRWPRGQLVEEREVVWIQSLAASGNRDAAAKRAEQFQKSFPKSVLLPAVNAAVGEK